MPYIIGAIILMLVIAGIINFFIVNNSKEKRENKEHFPFEEEDCYNGKFDRERNRFRRKDT